MALLDRLRQPGYTGENRCIPCTSVNVALAAASSALVAKMTSRRLASTAFVTSLGAIYLRGYLVPGTPTLTKRYLPERVLRWFDNDTPSMKTPLDAYSTFRPETAFRSTNRVTRSSPTPTTASSVNGGRARPPLPTLLPQPNSKTEFRLGLRLPPQRSPAC